MNIYTRQNDQGFVYISMLLLRFLLVLLVEILLNNKITIAITLILLFSPVPDLLMPL